MQAASLAMSVYSSINSNESTVQMRAASARIPSAALTSVSSNLRSPVVMSPVGKYLFWSTPTIPERRGMQYTWLAMAAMLAPVIAYDAMV